MSTENWHQERTRLSAQLKALVSGKTTNFDADETGQLRQETTNQAIDRVKARLAELDRRLGEELECRPAQKVGDKSPNPSPEH